jgi:predicted transcriptional regulator
MNKVKKDEVIIFRVSGEVKDKLRRKAEAQKTKLSKVAREALIKGLE